MAPIRVLSSRPRTATAHSTPIGDLPAELLDRWRGLHDALGTGASPFLHPEYVRTVAEVRENVEVCVIVEDGEPAGFMPYQRGPLGVGYPVGGRLCDHSGAVVRQGLSWSPHELARASKLAALNLRNVHADDAHFGKTRQHPAEAPYLDLSHGFEAYRAANLRTGSSFIRQLERRRRKIESEVAPLRFCWHTHDDRVFEALMTWKSRQRNATRTPNVLDLPWARELVERLRRTRSDDLGGVLSALYSGDTLIAAHFGIRTRRVLHYWIPAYSDWHRHYSPGLLALLEMARAGAQRGISRIDLGVGDERYKGRAATGARPVVTATFSAGGAVGALVTAAVTARARSRASSADKLARAASRALLRASYALRAFLSAPRGLPGGWRS